MALRDYLAGEVAQDFADGLLSRREALRRLALLGLGLTGASALLAACGGDEDDTSQPAPTTAAPTTTAGAAAQGRAELVRFRGPAGELQAAWAAADAAKGAVLVIHENRGLTPHFYDVVGRLANEGYSALCVDLLSDRGGTAALSDPAAAPAALGEAPLERLLADLRAGIDELERRVAGRRVAVVGFCFGGGMAWNLLHAGEARLAAVVPFYGPAPENPDFRRARAAVLGVYAELDSRVNASRERARAALEAAGLTHEIRTFAGADHAFFNDTGQRYNERATREAYAALLAWFDRHLAGRP
jgi:carboxymethylenebutenolidase